MNVRHAACNPCRKAKAACDHRQPTCERCQERGQAALCVYRARPFQRRRLHPTQITPREEQHELPRSPSDVRTTGNAQPQVPHYPNPGFLGASSHSAILGHVSTGPGAHVASNGSFSVPDDQSNRSVEASDDAVLFDSWADARALQALDYATLAGLKALVETWLDTGTNLPLAGPMVRQCAKAVHAVVNGSTTLAPRSTNCVTGLSDYNQALSRNTAAPFVLHRDTTFGDFISQMTGPNTRWETLGILFVAASRAALDVSRHSLLYRTEHARRSLVKLLTRAADCCLEASLALDCINDLQMTLQYEHFILSSQVYGDQNYRTWRKMGDLATSLFALGHHEIIDEDALQIPRFISELRKAASCRIYHADKNLALFLGRPPRITRPYYCMQLPSCDSRLWEHIGGEEDSSLVGSMNYTLHTRCVASFASLKEDALAAFRSDDSTHRIESARTLISEADRLWEAFPAHFKLQTSLNACQGSGFERDFLIGIKLDYLHTRLLSQLLMQSRVGEPDESILRTSNDMLCHVIEVIALRDKLINSGTSLIWKVAHFGLPAAGVVALALLRPTTFDASGRLSRPRMLQNLSAFIAEINLGAVIQKEDPDWALFARATSTIQSLLDTLMTGDSMGGFNNRNDVTSVQQQTSSMVNEWEAWIHAEPWDSEMDFWANLAEHPALQQADYEL